MRTLLLLLLLLPLPLVGIAGAERHVVATTAMIADVVRAVGGERVQVSTIIGEGVDPHLYQPTRSDRKLLQSADIVFYNGLLLEGRMQDVFVQVAGSRPVFAVTELLDPAALIDAGDHADPHVWNDPGAWASAVDVIATKLGELDTAGADIYRQQADAYRRHLAALDAYAKRIVATVPEERRVLVTAHDAFNYFGRAYGFEVQGIQGISTDAEASLEDINRLVGLLVERRIPAIFVESSVPEKNVRALIEGAAAKGHQVGIGGELFSDAMGVEGSWEGTYLGMQDHNVSTVVRALGGTVPDEGFRGSPEHLAMSEP